MEDNVTSDSTVYQHPCTKVVSPPGIFPGVLCNVLYTVRWRGSTPKRDDHTCREWSEK